MKILKRIGWIVLALVAIISLVGLFLPSKVHVERSIMINQTAEVPFNMVNDLTKWNLWSPWYKMDSLAPYVFAEITAGKGASFSWTSKHQQVGTGKLTIQESVPNSLLKIELAMQDWDASEIEFTFIPAGDGTKVTWSMNSDMGYNVIGRWFGLMMDAMMGDDFENGLADIKRVSEATPATEKVAGFEVQILNMPEIIFASIAHSKVEANQIGMKIGESLFKLDGYLKENKISMTSYPFTMWKDPANFSVCLPVAKFFKPSAEIVCGKIDSGKAVVVKYYGAYEKTYPVYMAMDAYMKSKQLNPIGAPREVYVTDPMMEKDTAKWLTEIIFPVN